MIRWLENWKRKGAFDFPARSVKIICQTIYLSSFRTWRLRAFAGDISGSETFQLQKNSLVPRDYRIRWNQNIESSADPSANAAAPAANRALISSAFFSSKNFEFIDS
jgi:hypothetical protein